MFKTEKYLTCGVNETITIVLQLIMWKMVADIPIEKDYLQIFRLSGENGIQTIVHEQEQPEYRKEHLFPSDTPITAKIFVIDDETHTTMLLAEEY